MYSGAGPGPMLTAAAFWAALAAELHTAGLAYDSTIAELSNGWAGPSATAMAAAAAPYAKWMHTTSAQAEQTAAQAKAAVAAYETAFAMTVPPPVVAANRSLLMALLATNFLGQNTPAIAATETHYAEMWAQDATAMYGYAGSAAVAAKLTAFTEPPQTTNPAGPAGQAGPVGQAAAVSAAGHTDTVISLLTHALQGLASPTAAMPSGGSALLTAAAPAAITEPAIEFGIAGIEVLVDAIGTFGVDVLGTFMIEVIGADVIAAGLLSLGELTAFSSPVAASLGGAALLTGLSVPQAWAVAVASATQQEGTALLASAAGPAVAASETAVPVAGMATAGLAGRATAAVGGGNRGGTGAETTRHRPPRQGEQPLQPQRQPSQRRPIMGIDVELLELAELRNAGILTDEEYAQQKRRLRSR